VGGTRRYLKRTEGRSSKPSTSGFESRAVHAMLNGPAEAVRSARLPLKQEIEGSNPSRTTHDPVDKRLSHPPFKRITVGSNPTGATGTVRYTRRGVEQFGSSLGS
jgi:hypothetical protein